MVFILGYIIDDVGISLSPWDAPHLTIYTAPSYVSILATLLAIFLLVFYFDGRLQKYFTPTHLIEVAGKKNELRGDILV